MVGETPADLPAGGGIQTLPTEYGIAEGRIPPLTGITPLAPLGSLPLGKTMKMDKTDSECQTEITPIPNVGRESKQTQAQTDLMVKSEGGQKQTTTSTRALDETTGDAGNGKKSVAKEG